MLRAYWAFFTIFAVATLVAAANSEWLTSAVYAFAAGLYMVNICLVRAVKAISKARIEQERAQTNYLAALRELKEGAN